MLKRKEITGVMISLISAKLLLVYPHQIVKNSGQAAWIEVLYAIAIAAAVFFVTSKVYQYKKSVIELCEELGGRGPRIFTGSILAVILITNLAYTARLFPETVKITLLKEINIEVINMVFAISMGAGAYFGLKALARVNYLFLPIGGLVLIGCLVLSVPHFKAENLFPILGEGPKKIFLSGINTLSLFGDMIALNLLLPHSNSLSDAKKSAVSAFFISSAVALLITGAYCLTYVYPASAKYIMPIYQLARIIQISNFFSRFEAFFQLIWTILIFNYSAIYIVLICEVLQATFSLKYNKPLIFPVTVIIITLAGVPTTVNEAILAGELTRAIEYPVLLLLPIICGAAAMRSRKRIRQKTN